MTHDIVGNDRTGLIQNAHAWPALPLAAWQDTYETLHMWTQIIGKIRLQQCTPLNHWWHVSLYVTARGLTTSPIPYRGHTYEISFDFLAHELRVETSWGTRRAIPLRPQSVATFYRETMALLRALGIPASIWTTPVEVPNPIPFDQDEVHAAYDPEYAQRFWRILVQAQRVLMTFRGGFLGKVSPVHFFWGSFDLAVTRFSGRRAPQHPGAPHMPDVVTREAYSHEVSSAGFWPGGSTVDEPVFYAYAYPEPPGFPSYRVQPAEAFYSPAVQEFLLPYEVVRQSAMPDSTLLEFLQTTYEAAANLGNWDRAALERPMGPRLSAPQQRRKEHG